MHRHVFVTFKSHGSLKVAGHNHSGNFIATLRRWVHDGCESCGFSASQFNSHILGHYRFEIWRMRSWS